MKQSRIGYKTVVDKDDISKLEEMFVVLEDNLGNRKEVKIENYLVQLALEGESSEMMKTLDEITEALEDTAVNLLLFQD